MIGMDLTARKLKIDEIVRGQYKQSSEGEPNRLVTPWGEDVLRARFIATITEKFIRDDKGYATLRLDDGSDTIRAKAWGEGVAGLEKFNVGNLVEVIGNIREYDGEIHLVPDFLNRIDDPNWELVRELEILQSRKKLASQGKVPAPKETSKKESMHSEDVEEDMGAVEMDEKPLPKVPEDVKEKVILAIEKLEGNKGTSSADIAAELDITQKESEDALRVLMVEDEVFEPKAGKFKRLR